MREPLQIDAPTLMGMIGHAELLHLGAVVPADCGRIDVSHELEALRKRLNAQRDTHLQPWFVLLDECIQFFVQFERFLYEERPSSEMMAYVVTVSRLKRDLISIRELLAIGQDMTANVVAREFVENLEIAMALALSSDICQAYITTDDTHTFWNKHIGYGRVYELMLQYSACCDVVQARAKQWVERHKEAKRMFSDSTHGGRDSSLFSAFSPSLVNPDEVHFMSLGSHTYHTQFLALFVTQETQAFAGSMVKGTMRPNPLHLYREFRPTGRFMNAAA